ncbi:MAG TPA: zinc ribbon domain-containing protein [Syntrophorhabdaceae bacterium]|nr:zinc ribbon domain-containing protein [Syntrophorhabdaceae bacterium]
MPIYEYQCSGCGKRFEIFQKISEKPLTECRVCKGKLTKLISNCAFHLKGSGWYVTDYKKPTDSVGNKNGAKAKEKKSEHKETKQETAEAKTEAKTENKGAASTGGET